MHRRVQVLQLVQRRLSAVGPDVCLGEVELRAQVAESDRRSVLDGDGVHAGEGDVLGCEGEEPSQRVSNSLYSDW